mmetsp:Transcript_72392/g.151077  ORF Transcript_72392/g.151077 Transcript_72392/m.151077 type:complete len:301 (+) Transcript_72392:208-1110(+)
MASSINAQEIMERLTIIAKKILHTTVIYAKKASVVAAQKGHELAEVTRETVVPAIKQYSHDAAICVRDAAVSATEKAKEARTWECFQLRDVDSEGTQDNKLSIDDLLSIIFLNFKKLPDVGKVVLMMLLFRSGAAFNSTITAFLQEMLTNTDKKRVKLFFASAFSSFCLAGYHFHGPLVKGVPKALKDDGPVEAGLVLVRNSTRMPTAFWVATVPGATLSIDFAEKLAIATLQLVVRMPMRFRHAAFVMVVALLAGKIRSNKGKFPSSKEAFEAMSDRSKLLYAKMMKVCFPNATPPTEK